LGQIGANFTLTIFSSSKTKVNMENMSIIFMYEIEQWLKPTPNFLLKMAISLLPHFERETNMPWHKHIYIALDSDSKILIEANMTHLQVHIVLPNNFGVPALVSWMDFKSDKPINPSEKLSENSELQFLWSHLPTKQIEEIYEEKPWRKTFMFLKKDAEKSIDTGKLSQFIKDSIRTK
jgi:hypothetical protein